MELTVHVHYKAHPKIVASFRKLALVSKGQRKLIERIQFHEESPVMQRIIHDPNTSHTCIATLLTSLARSYQEFGQLQKAVMVHEQSLNMECAIYGTDAVHPETA